MINFLKMYYYFPAIQSVKVAPVRVVNVIVFTICNNIITRPQVASHIILHHYK